MSMKKDKHLETYKKRLDEYNTILNMIQVVQLRLDQKKREGINLEGQLEALEEAFGFDRIEVVNEMKANKQDEDSNPDPA